MNSSENTSPSVRDLEQAVAATSINNGSEQPPVEPMDCDTPVVFPAPATELYTEDEIKSTIKDLETARNRIQEFEGQINTIMSDVYFFPKRKNFRIHQVVEASSRSFSKIQQFYFH